MLRMDDLPDARSSLGEGEFRKEEGLLAQAFFFLRFSFYREMASIFWAYIRALSAAASWDSASA